MNLKRILSAFLALIFVFGIAGEFAIDTGAAWEDKVDSESKPIINYYQKSYSSGAEKLKDMTLFKEEKGYQIYVEEFTGEVAFVNSATGEAIFSNPYDLAANANSSSTKNTLLSQITISFKENEEDKVMNSYKDAALSGYNQIKTKNIKNGVRMEYTIGEIQVTRLVPRRIPKDRFENLILAKVPEDAPSYVQLKAFYQLYDSSDPGLNETLKKEMEAKYPITKRMAIYVCSADITSGELKNLESIIKTYCPLYTMDEMDQDHTETDYVGVDIAPPCFRMALEYTVGDDGSLDVRLPANAIRFDESVYKINTVTVLPYMGAGNNENEGYTFFPDGAGSIINFADVRGVNSVITGSVYGRDYAYHSVTGKREETIRYPVFGNVIEKESESGSSKTGFVAIITEGDSLAQIVTENGGQLHKYSSVCARFTPRPSDKYNLSSSVVGGSNASWTVVTNRKYSGSYRIKYILLSDKEAQAGNSYECSYVGMAKAYRDYLIGQGAITKLTSSDVKSDMPLYIETFGSIETMDKFLSFPVTVDTPLTTFEDVQTMYNELSEAGVKNINFRLTGFANGGLDSTYPAKVDWVSALGGGDGFENLVSYAGEKDFGVYPDFDFAYVTKTAYFDGVTIKRDLIKTIDGRYTSRKYYDSATQSLESDFAQAISPSRYEYFCNEFTGEYSQYGANSLSVSSMGTDLNSDFDKDDPYNREDSKKFTAELLASLSESFGDVMVNGGNAYSLPYADHIIDAPLDSSRYMSASAAVPFAGIVLHGFVNFAGSAVNMEGDIDYAILKSIESGAGLYFTLAYQNTNALKESSTYNKYYSVNYQNWRDDVVEKYGIINEALKDLQTVSLDNHAFLSGYRIPSAAELEEDEKFATQKADEAAEKEEKEKEKAELDALLADRKGTTAKPFVPNKTKPTAPNKTTADGTVYSTETKYQTAEGTIVLVEYENGTSFILNYNSHDVYVKYNNVEYVIGSLDFVKVG